MNQDFDKYIIFICNLPFILKIGLVSFGFVEIITYLRRKPFRFHFLIFQIFMFYLDSIL